MEKQSENTEVSGVYSSERSNQSDCILSKSDNTMYISAITPAPYLQYNENFFVFLKDFSTDKKPKITKHNIAEKLSKNE